MGEKYRFFFILSRLHCHLPPPPALPYSTCSQGGLLKRKEQRKEITTKTHKKCREEENSSVNIFIFRIFPLLFPIVVPWLELQTLKYVMERQKRRKNEWKRKKPLVDAIKMEILPFSPLYFLHHVECVSQHTQSPT